MKKHIYVLGTATSHNGSACLLKDGKVSVAIEKERITRIKHDGGNDSAAIDYCLKAENITINDVDLVVQNANFGNFKFGNDYLQGVRPFNDQLEVPVVTISHHLAHAYSAIGTCPFDKYNILVMDGCGNSYDDCIDLQGAHIPEADLIHKMPHLFNEKDSYYRFDENGCNALIKDFSEWGFNNKAYPMHPNTTKHSIGGLYAAASLYCFGNVDDVGKLMGLGPYGRPGIFKEHIFELKDGRVFVNYDWMYKFSKPARSFNDFKNNFQYYADIAYGIQTEIERAVMYIVQCRLAAYPAQYLCYCGGTALNAVANAKLLGTGAFRDLYIEPAAGDNGLALGCAYYGWLNVLKKEKVKHNGTTCFGITYSAETIKQTLDTHTTSGDILKMKKTVDVFFNLLNKKKNPLEGTKANIQFNIEDIGVYQVSIGDDIKSGKQLWAEPTCLIDTTAKDLCEVLYDPRLAEGMIKTRQFKISNIPDLMLLKRLDMNQLALQLKRELNENTPNDEPELEYAWCEDYISRTADLLARGNIIAWFQDGCEFGPRALGRRSILADPRTPDVRNFINKEIKRREDFRPFAPSVLLEDVSEYFQNNRSSPYMILVDYIRDDYREMLKSIVHENNTSRIQTVTPDWNSKYYELLKEFKKVSGISVLLNTSFNRKGMPIVETPREALQMFLSSRIDYLVMDKYIISKKRNPLAIDG